MRNTRTQFLHSNPSHQKLARFSLDVIWQPALCEDMTVQGGTFIHLLKNEYLTLHQYFFGNACPASRCKLWTYWMVGPESIHTYCMECHWKFLGGGGALKGQTFIRKQEPITEEKCEAKLELPGGLRACKNLVCVCVCVCVCGGRGYGYFLEIHKDLQGREVALHRSWPLGWGICTLVLENKWQLACGEWGVRGGRAWNV